MTNKNLGQQGFDREKEKERQQQQQKEKGGMGQQQGGYKGFDKTHPNKTK